MTITRIINGRPVEFELTEWECWKLYDEGYENRMGANFNWALENMDDDKAMEISENLEACPELRKKVIQRFIKYCQDILSGDQEIAAAVDAYDYIMKGVPEIDA